jgi:class 3 adenylate cyclase
VTRWLPVAASVAAVAFGVAWGRARREAGRLRRRLLASANELERLQSAFARFAPRQLVDRIASGRAPAAERSEVTILFADLVGFTALGARLEPEALVRVLNEHFRRMSRITDDHRGHVAKFIGDGFMALFGAHEPNPWQSNDAAHAALAMQTAVEEQNRERVAAGLPALRMGIGIHRGSVVAGVIGSAELQEFTVIGAAVNLASRIERMTRTEHAAVLLTAAVREHLDPRFAVRALPPRAVRGVDEPVGMFRLDGFTES